MAFYGLSHAQNASKYLSQFVALAPCMVSDLSVFPEVTETNYNLLSTALSLLGIESLFGPNWSEQVSTMCTILGEDSEECIQLRSVPLGPAHENGILDGLQEVGVKQSLHMAQNYLEDRFQEYAEWYLFGWEFFKH